MMREAPDELYPDTAEGALQCLRDMSDLNLNGAFATPDPWVNGVWLVNLSYDEGSDSPCQAIVYLAGVSDSMGQVREYNDFECFYESND